MTTEELLDAIRNHEAHIDWGHVTSEHNGHKLRIAVMSDAIRFDNVPPMNWHREPRAPRANEQATYDGVRLPATANEMQQVADLLGSMMLTPKVLDLIWQQAGQSGTQLESVVNVGGQIVALSDIHLVHEAVEAAIVKAGGHNGGILEAVGKYWVLSNRLVNGKFGLHQAVNYAWFTKGRGNGPGVTNTVNVWQTLGAAHNSQHIDPSQVIRLMYRWGWLLRNGSSTWEQVDLAVIAKDPDLAGLLSHEGVLKTTRMLDVPEPQAVLQEDGTYLLPEVYVLGDPLGSEPEAS